MSSKILIADDEQLILLLMERTLLDLEDEDAEIEILTAGNGSEALEMIRAEKPDLVFLDVMMPLMDGFDVCNTVKREWDMQEVYIVILTAKGQTIDVQRGGEVGADRYMTKPFDPDEVLEIARGVLGLSG